MELPTQTSDFVFNFLMLHHLVTSQEGFRYDFRFFLNIKKCCQTKIEVQMHKKSSIIFEI
jgi:hypothetical protein